MHRVELKDIWQGEGVYLDIKVPNAPCGVERRRGEVIITLPHPVRFLMHRVELKGDFKRLKSLDIPKFLMHRVELKVLWNHKRMDKMPVPNAPCGVESPLRPLLVPTPCFRS
jgi:hypothetical protein